MHDSKKGLNTSHIRPKRSTKLDPLNNEPASNQESEERLQHKLSGESTFRRMGTTDILDLNSLQAEAAFYHIPVPIFELKKKTYKVNLVQTDKIKEVRPYFAKGTLIGNYDSDFRLEDKPFQAEFVGNFEGTFEHQADSVDYYFEGKIYNLQFFDGSLNDPHAGAKDNLLSHRDVYDITTFRGFFKGQFIPLQARQGDLMMSVGSNPAIDTKQSKGREFFVPALMRMDVREITHIDLEQCAAEMIAYLHIHIQFNQKIAALLKSVWDQKKKITLPVDFNRDKPLLLPFYDPDGQYNESQDESEYEWDDPLDGFDVIDWKWEEETCRMKWTVRSEYNGQIDNTYGVFYAPMNITNLRFVVNLHAVKVGKDTIHPVCCDLQDFRFDKKYSPYTFFSELEDNEESNIVEERLAKKIDRLTKITVGQFRDQGEFGIAQNRTHMFPFHKNINQNSNSQTDDFMWILGFKDRKEYLEHPIASSVKEGYLQAEDAAYNFDMDENQRRKISNNAGIFKMQKWQYMHIGIPLYKYAVIDIINLYVPFIILSAISLLFFTQQNGKNEDNITSLGKRIASGAGILLAFIAFIPIIRQRLPPSPSITFMEVGAYLSTIPNVLGIIHGAVDNSRTTRQFFDAYDPFRDPYFLTSFIGIMILISLSGLSILVFVIKQYKCDFLLDRFKPSSFERARNPIYMRYMASLIHKRPQMQITQDLPNYLAMENYEE